LAQPQWRSVLFRKPLEAQVVAPPLSVCDGSHLGQEAAKGARPVGSLRSLRIRLRVQGDRDEQGPESAGADQLPRWPWISRRSVWRAENSMSHGLHSRAYAMWQRDLLVSGPVRLQSHPRPANADGPSRTHDQSETPRAVGL